MRRKALYPLAAAAAAAGALAIANRKLRAPQGALVSRLGGTEHVWRWRGHDIFAAEAGSGPLVLLVHGIYAGSSSYEYRLLFPLLARRYRVVAFDLLGNGLSDRPNVAYSAELFVEQIFAAVAHFGPTAAALVGSSLGGAFTLRAAARLGSSVGAVAAICPTGLEGALDRPPGAAGKAITRLFRSPLLGEALFNLLASYPLLDWFLKNQAYADPDSVTPEILDAYWAATHQPGARYVPAHFVGGALNCDLSGDLPQIAAPVLIAWGERADEPSPVSSASSYVALARRGELATFPRSRLLPHEEEPEACAQRLERFITRSTG